MISGAAVRFSIVGTAATSSEARPVHRALPVRNEQAETRRARCVRVSCLGLLLAASVMAGCSAQSPSVARTPTPYDYGAVCDFTFARLFDLNARISDAQKSSIEQLHGVPTKFPIFLYRDTTASVRYVQLANGNHVLDASLLPNAIYFTDHDKAHLLGRLGFVNNQPSQVSADCEFFSLQLRFSGSQLERVQITGRAPD